MGKMSEIAKFIKMFFPSLLLQQICSKINVNQVILWYFWRRNPIKTFYAWNFFEIWNLTKKILSSLLRNIFLSHMYVRFRSACSYVLKVAIISIVKRSKNSKACPEACTLSWKAPSHSDLVDLSLEHAAPWSKLPRLDRWLWHQNDQLRSWVKKMIAHINE